ncbi:MAG: MGMT family protein [Oscillospiraceae bacterium]|nr:MGMT family protein [Oscillospiraceae bacterium]
MSKVLTEELIYQVLSVVEEIPAGSVSTYGQIAALIGREKNSRLVGKVLSISDYYGRYPCHRVVNHCGRLAPGFTEQRERLQQEGVTFQSNGNVNMRLHKWQI